MKHTEQRKKLRAILAGNQCVCPASVYDALSARVAESVGYQVGLLAGSVVSSTTMAAPDIMLQTATDYAEQIRRIMRFCNLSLFVDADNGYGNALNVMRTVEEFEHAGVSGLAIEDTGGYTFGKFASQPALVSVEEEVGKLKAALRARSDPSLVICARSPAFKLEGMESLLARAKAYAATGVDGLHITGGIQTLEQIKAVHDVLKKPIILGSTKITYTREQLASVGVRIQLQGHQEVAGVVKTLREIYTHLHSGGSPEDLNARIAPPEEMDRLLSNSQYERWFKDYMQ